MANTVIYNNKSYTLEEGRNTFQADDGKYFVSFTGVDVVSSSNNWLDTTIPLYNFKVDKAIDTSNTYRIQGIQLSVNNAAKQVRTSYPQHQIIGTDSKITATNDYSYVYYSQILMEGPFERIVGKIKSDKEAMALVYGTDVDFYVKQGFTLKDAVLRVLKSKNIPNKILSSTITKIINETYGGFQGVKGEYEYNSDFLKLIHPAFLNMYIGKPSSVEYGWDGHGNKIGNKKQFDVSSIIFDTMINMIEDFKPTYVDMGDLIDNFDNTLNSHQSDNFGTLQVGSIVVGFEDDSKMSYKNVGMVVGYGKYFEPVIAYIGSGGVGWTMDGDGVKYTSVGIWDQIWKINYVIEIPEVLLYLRLNINYNDYQQNAMIENGFAYTDSNNTLVPKGVSSLVYSVPDVGGGANKYTSQAKQSASNPIGPNSKVPTSSKGVENMAGGGGSSGAGTGADSSGAGSDSGKVYGDHDTAAYETISVQTQRVSDLMPQKTPSSQVGDDYYPVFNGVISNMDKFVSPMGFVVVLTVSNNSLILSQHKSIMDQTGNKPGTTTYDDFGKDASQIIQECLSMAGVASVPLDNVNSMGGSKQSVYMLGTDTEVYKGVWDPWVNFGDEGSGMGGMPMACDGMNLKQILEAAASPTNYETFFDEEGIFFFRPPQFDVNPIQGTHYWIDFGNGGDIKDFKININVKKAFSGCYVAGLPTIVASGAANSPYDEVKNDVPYRTEAYVSNDKIFNWVQSDKVMINPSIGGSGVSFSNKYVIDSGGAIHYARSMMDKMNCGFITGTLDMFPRPDFLIGKTVYLKYMELVIYISRIVHNYVQGDLKQCYTRLYFSHPRRFDDILSFNDYGNFSSESIKGMAVVSFDNTHSPNGLVPSSINVNTTSLQTGQSDSVGGNTGEISGSDVPNGYQNTTSPSSQSTKPSSQTNYVTQDQMNQKTAWKDNIEIGKQK